MEEQVATYMQAKFRHKVLGHTGVVRFPSDWPLSLLLECDHAVRVLTDAFRNQSELSLLHNHKGVTFAPVPTEWDVERYCDYLTMRQGGVNRKHEAELLDKFPPLHSGTPLPVLQDPAVLTDKHGVALVWYLPGLISEERHRDSWNSSRSLESDLTIVKSKNWRSGPQFFKSRSSCERRPGTVTLAPAWFQQGQHVSVAFPFFPNGS